MVVEVCRIRFDQGQRLYLAKWLSQRMMISPSQFFSGQKSEAYVI
jgi:hypothetical protein